MSRRRLGIYGVIVATLLLVAMLATGWSAVSDPPAPAARALPAHPPPRVVLRAGLRVGRRRTVVHRRARHPVRRLRVRRVHVRRVRLTVRRAGLGSGTVTVDGEPGGCAAGCDLAAGTTATVRAAYDRRATTVVWQGARCSSHICSLRLGADTTVTARLAPRQYALAVRGRGPGRVAECSGRRSCSLSYRYGQTATLVATPRAGGVVAGWDDCVHSRANRCTVRMTRPRSVAASFAGAPGVRLKVQTTGRGSVTIGARDSCAAGCLLRRGLTVVLHAHYDRGAETVAWSVPGCSGSTCRVVIQHAATVTARFEPRHVVRVLLHVRVEGVGAVDVCGRAHRCSRTYRAGLRVRLAANPAAGRFLGWKGCRPDGADTCTVVMSRERMVTARFAAQATLVVTAAGPGTVTADGRDCSKGCGFPKGHPVEIQARYDPAAVTVTWEGADCSGDVCTVPVDHDMTVRAVFAPRSQPPSGPVP